MSKSVKLIIEIPKSDYETICANKEDAIIAHDTCRRIAKNGIPLDTIKTLSVPEREKTMKLSEVYKLLGGDMRGE